MLSEKTSVILFECLRLLCSKLKVNWAKLCSGIIVRAELLFDLGPLRLS